ncbi:MAG TPA: class I SAM-dependent methyltransferase [Ornithinibacter sp.]|nr:class I SAM-dependent methyltransferase [Ornithinibacter sp.]
MAEVQHSSTTTEHRSDYWDEYYAARATTRRPLPSQFATFVAGELDRPHRVIELGCGNGRDSIFFSSFGHEVVGVDGSEAAVAASSHLAEALGEKVTFVRSAIDDPALADRLGEGEGPKALYARFFVHAITDEEEQVLLDLAATVTRPGDLLAVEYRTIRDQVGAKETETHYRRFVLPATFQARALERGFEVTYAVEGFGFAKYRHDDAYVARTLFRRV